jgi:transposase
VNGLEKERILAMVTGSPLPRQQLLAQLGISKSTYYRWLRLQAEGRLQDSNVKSRIAWNKLKPEEEQIILARARALPELTIGQLALRITDSDGVYVSESTMHRILKREGLVKPGKRLGFNIGKEYHRKTRGTHELWVIDSVCINMFNRGWYHLVTVMDDYSRFIFSWKLLCNLTEDTLSELLQEAVDLIEMTDIPVEDRTALGSEHGTSNLYWRFNEYIRLAGLKHIIASPYEYETNGEMEMNHSAMSGEITLLPKEAPGALEAVAKSFIQYHNYMRYDNTLGYVTPFHVYSGRDVIVRRRRREVRSRTLEARRRYNGAIKN